MQMPSLFKYFAFVGGALFALVSFVSYLLDPSTGATPVAVQPKPLLVVRHDPQASKIERWRDEQAALKAQQEKAASGMTSIQRPAPQTEPGALVPVKAAATSQQAKTQAPAEPKAEAATAAKPQPAAVQPAPLAVADAALNPVQPAADTQAAEPDEQAKAQKAKAKARAEKARKHRLARARERQRAMEQADASSRQDEYYYGQRRAYAPAYAYAPPPPRPSYGPFGGWDRTW